jgi:4-amino-4-deoxy-L-arabinose transferase-like glycosyltransferase
MNASGRSWAVLWVLLAGLLVYAAWLWLHPPALSSGETSHWWPIIINVARGQGYSGCFPEYFPFCHAGNQVTAAREPLPVLVFASVARLFGDSFCTAGILEIAVNLAVLAALFSLAKNLAGEKSAILASVLWIAYLPALKLIPQVSGDLIATLAVTAGVLFFTRALRSGSPREYLAAGITLAMGGLSRSVVLVVAPLLFGGGLLQSTGALRQRIRPLVLFMAAFASVLLPWGIRNYLAFGRPVVASTMAGYNLYRHNYQLPQEHFLRYVAGEEAAGAVKLLLNQRKSLRGDENEAEMDEVYREEAGRVIRAWPGRYLALTAYRFLPLWFGWGVPEAYGVRPRLDDYLVMIEQAVLLGLAAAGLKSLRARAWPVVATAALICLLQMAVVGQMRYVVPVMPLVLALSAGGIALPGSAG